MMFAVYDDMIQCAACVQFAMATFSFYGYFSIWLDIQLCLSQQSNARGFMSSSDSRLKNIVPVIWQTKE